MPMLLTPNQTSNISTVSRPHAYTSLICLGYSVFSSIPTFDSQEPSFTLCFHSEFDSKIDNDDAWELFSTYEWFGVLLFHVFIHTHFFCFFFLLVRSAFSLNNNNWELFNFECCYYFIQVFYLKYSFWFSYKIKSKTNRKIFLFKTENFQ